MKYKIFVDGQERTTGLKIHDYLYNGGKINEFHIGA